MNFVTESEITEIWKLQITAEKNSRTIVLYYMNINYVAHIYYFCQGMPFSGISRQQLTFLRLYIQFRPDFKGSYLSKFHPQSSASSFPFMGIRQQNSKISFLQYT
jgi:hypothetical protein